MEIWKPIPGYEGYYEASSQGRIRSTAITVKSSSRNGGSRHRPSRVLRLKKRRNGYLCVQLSRAGVARDELVHRLVSWAFHGTPPPGKEVVNHKNLNKTDNRPENLEWCSCADNNRHSRANQEYKRNPNKKLVRCVEANKVFDGSYDAAKWVNEHDKKFSGNIAVMSRRIRGCACGAAKTAYGYRWVDEPSTTIPNGSTPKRVEKGDPS